MTINFIEHESIYVVSYFSENGKFSNLFCTHDQEYAVHQIIKMAKAFGEEFSEFASPIITREKDNNGYIFYAVWQDKTLETLLGRYFIDELSIIPSSTPRTLN